MPSTTPIEPEYPFQHLCADYFHHEGASYLVLVDRYSGWPIVTKVADGASGLITVLRDTFSAYGIPETLTSDGGPEFAAHATRDFLKSWSVHHRIASAYYPHGNCRAEVAVKSTKRLIAGKTGPGGKLAQEEPSTTPSTEPSCNTGTPPAPAQACLRPTASSGNPPATCSPASQKYTALTRTGLTASSSLERALSNPWTSTLGRTLPRPVPPSLR